MRFPKLCAALAVLLAACQPLPTRPPAPEAPAAAAPASTQAGNAAATAQEPAPEPAYLMPEPAEIRRGETLFARLVERFALPPCAESDASVQRWIAIHTRHPPRFRSELEATLPLMALALEETERLRLPGEYVLAPIIESGYRPEARGAGDHAGLWQFGAPTARHRGLTVRADYDGRLAPAESTRAALSYLAQLQNDFRDPRLALFAYNAGPYRIRRLLDADAARRPPEASPQQMHGLPKTSVEYLARIQALACILAQPRRFDVELPLDATIEPLRTVALPPGASSLSAIAGKLALDAKPLARLNPAYRRGYISRDAPRELLLPESQLPAFAALDALPAAPEPAWSAAETHVVASGDTLGGIARRYRVPLAELMAINRLTSRSVLRIGQRIRLAH